TVRAQWLLDDDAAEPDWTLFGDDISVTRSTSPVMPGTRFVNVTPAGVTKASGVLRVAEAYDVPPARAMMIGDAENDLEAMRTVGWPVAMGNASPEVRAAARDIVGHVDSGGLVQAFELALVRGG
ncbi:MAG TPA: HAD hydrolase family protein, partial [Longimicrobiales bacterium]